MTGYRASMWIRCAGSYCATRRTPQEHPGTNTPTCCSSGNRKSRDARKGGRMGDIQAERRGGLGTVRGSSLAHPSGNTYPTDDDEARQRALADAESTGSMSVFVHAQETMMELREAANKTGSSDLYDKSLRTVQQRDIETVPREHAHHRGIGQGNTGTRNRPQGRGGEGHAGGPAGHPGRAQLQHDRHIRHARDRHHRRRVLLPGKESHRTGEEDEHPHPPAYELRPAGGRRLSVRGIRDREADRLQRTEKRQEAGAAEIQKAKEKAATTGEREDEEEEIPETGKESPPKEKKNALKNAYNWLKRFSRKPRGKTGQL